MRWLFYWTATLTDFASIGIQMDSRPVTDGTAALDKLAETSGRVEQKINVLNGQMSDTAAIMRKNAEASGAASQAAQQFLAPLQREIDMFGMSRAEAERYNAAKAGLTATTQRQAAILGATIDAMKRDEQAARDVAAAQDQAARAGDQFIKKLNEQVAVLGMNAQQLQAYRAAQLGVSDAAAPLIAKLGEAGAGAHGAGKHMEGLSLQTAGAKRELLVLAHELSQGNFQKFGGSMMVLGEQTGAAGLLFSAAGLAALGLAAAVGGIAYAMIKGAAEQKHMNDALVMTGNYAGMTSDSLNQLAHAAVEAGGSIGEAKKVATELAGSGKFTGDQIGYITEATVAWEHATGQSVKSIIKDFESLAVQTTGNSMRATEAISRAAVKLDDQYHFLTGAVYEQIRALEKEGDAKGASALATETFAKVTHDRAEEVLKSLGSIARGWNTVKETIGQAVVALGEFGQRSTPAIEVKKSSLKLQRFDEGLVGSNQRLGRPDYQMGDGQAEARTKIVLELTAAVDKLNKADAAGIAQGKGVAAQSEAVHAESRIADGDAKLQKKGLSETQIELNRYREDIEKVKAANPDSILVTPAAVAAHEAAIIKAHTATAKVIADQISDYDRLMKTLNEKLAVDTAAAFATDKLTDSEKMRAKMLADLAGGVTVMTAAEKINALAKLDVIDTLEKAKRGAEAMAKIQAAVTAESAKSIEAAEKEAIGNERLAQNWGLTKDQIAATELARLEEQLAQRASVGMTLDEISTLEKLISAKQRSAAAAATVQGHVDEQAATIAAAAASRKLADIAIQDWKNVGASVADSLSNAFGTAGKAAGTMFKAYADNAARQLQLNKELAIAKRLSDDDPQKLKAIDAIHAQSTQAQLKSYGDMAGAAQGFFKEGSRGYEAMGAASKVLHAAELAMNLASIAPAMAAGAAQFFAESGWGGFAGVAAMAAVVAGFGVAVSGGGSGGGQSAADAQKTQGTGSVFGDSSAKSDSIARSIALSSANSSIELTHTAGMLTALQSIQASMSGLANLIVRTPGMTDASNMNIQTGTLSRTGSGSTFATVGAVAGGVASGAYLGSMVGSFLGPLGAIAGGILGSIGGALVGKIASLWGNTKQNVVDSGFQFGGSVRGLQSGQGFNQYASVDTTKSSWFGLSKSTSNSVQTQGIDNDLSSQFGLVFTNLETSLKAAAVGLGGSAAQVGSALDHLTLSTSKISLKGLTGDALTSAISGVMSKAMDEMASAALPGYDRFRKVGEGYSETVTRVSADFQNVGSIFDSMGKSLVVTADTSGSGFANLIGGWFGRLTQNIVNNMSSSMPKVSTLSVDARERLIELAGGIDKMASQANSFSTNFLSKAEQLAPVTKYVADQMAALGHAGIDTRDQFKQLVLGLDVSTQKGAEQYTALMGLADAFAKTHEATVDLTKTTQEVADERKSMQDQLDQLTMTQVQLLTKQRNALDAANRPLFDMVQAAQKLAATSGDMAKFRDAAKSLHDGLLTGGLSTLTPEQQYAELRSQYDKTKAAAMGGDTTAQGNVGASLTALLTASQKTNGGDSQYQADFAMGQQDLASMASWAQGQVDSVQAQLTAMNDANSSLVAIVQGINNLPSALANMPINPANYGTSDNLAVLVASNKALIASNADLKAEVAGLRADQQKQTGNQIVANDQSNQANAETIVSGIGGLIGRVVRTVKQVELE